MDDIEYTLEDVVRKYTNTSRNQETYFDNKNALIILLTNTNLIFLSNVVGKEQYEDEDRPNELVTGLYINASDIFAWGCADSEPISTKEISQLFLMWHHDKSWGCIKWLCKKRNRRPQSPIVANMKKDGAWCEFMNSLPE
jgi:hypothetical protein